MKEQERNKLAELYPASAFAIPHHRTFEIFSDRSVVCGGEVFSNLLSLTVPNTYRYHFNYPSNEFGIPLVLHAKDIDYVFDRKYSLPNNTMMNLKSITRN
jgi:carboxylesterase type B